MIKFIKRNIFRNVLQFFKSVRVYDNYVTSYWPALSFRNKIRWALNSWIPIGSDSPFGRLCFLRGYVIHDGTPIVKYGKLSDMGKEFKNKKGSDCVWTHWSEYNSSKNLNYEQS